MSKRRRRLWSARVYVESAINYLRQDADDESAVIAILLEQVDRLHEMGRRPDHAAARVPRGVPPERPTENDGKTV